MIFLKRSIDGKLRFSRGMLFQAFRAEKWKPFLQILSSILESQASLRRLSARILADTYSTVRKRKCYSRFCES